MASWRSIASVTAAAALSVLAATAVVDAQSSGEQLEACAGDRGLLRLVAPGEACVGTERRVSWNVAGPIGPPGESGVAFERSAAARAALTRAKRSFSKRPKKLPKKRIAQLKAADATAGEARAAYRDGPVSLPSAIAAFLGSKLAQPPPVVASLALPAGRWVVNAKAQASLDYDPKQAVVAAGATYDTVSCQLRAGADTDASGADGFSSVLALQVVHRYTKPGLVQLECYGMLQPTLRNIKLTAIRVAKLKNQHVGG